MNEEILKKGVKTTQRYWNSKWMSTSEQKTPSILIVNNLNLTRLIKTKVTPRSRYIEIGCAPGNMLAWVSKTLKTNSTGLDYSEVGINKCKKLFENLNLEIDLHCINFFEHKLIPESFDFVTSFGLIEHFDDPSLIVKKHVELLKSGGTALITIPNYGGIYGYIQKWCDPDNLALHNLKIMNIKSLKYMASNLNVKSVNVYNFGKVDPLILSFQKKLPIFVVKLINITLNTIGLLQPLTINFFSPMLVLEIQK
jgi:2-polyprenyl-3-methyl-5-hydroxy-6-metoxy-1,4-benzoquinol methylase